jgi:hypothetical protein
MGGGWGSTAFGPKIPPNCKNKASGEVYLLNFFASFVFLSLSQKFGGILGSDAVLTICILCEKVKLPDPPRDERRNTYPIIGSITRRIAKQSIGSITPHTFSQKKFIKIILNNHFFIKIPFLLEISKNPYYK